MVASKITELIIEIQKAIRFANMERAFELSRQLFPYLESHQKNTIIMLEHRHNALLKNLLRFEKNELFQKQLYTANSLLESISKIEKELAE